MAASFRVVPDIYCAEAIRIDEVDAACAIGNCEDKSPDRALAFNLPTAIEWLVLN